MSHYVYGEVQADCDVQTMVRVLENMVPEWEGRIQQCEAGSIKLNSNYQQANSTYHIRVSTNLKGICYEDFGMRKEGDKWVVAMGGHSIVGKKKQKQFEEDLAGEVGRLRAQDMIQSVGGFSVDLDEENDDDDEWTLTFKVDGDKFVNDLL